MRGADVTAPDRAPEVKVYGEKVPGVGEPKLIARTFVGQPPMVRFWGVRGSIATPGEATLKYGGNTTCIEVRADGELLVCEPAKVLPMAQRYFLF